MCSSADICGLAMYILTEQEKGVQHALNVIRMKVA